ncbi:cardiolipin synthase [Ramlibacter sp. H39-3-26]|uniref:cardiolipin synthase n=1 Tax=Curvibacter soli TaxID=3031331 RepID=UPI0023DA3B9D|nr:cardiolipin synthase [Ramlibacter sp. H39-3-26]MDF1485273.1 cardiolipin synthase [Ramlibacter sp. H39-3-26]
MPNVLAYLPRDEVFTALSVLWGAYVVVLAGWIVLQKRSPEATMGWLLALAALPYVGFFIYYFFGPQRLRKQRLRRLRSQASLQGQRDVRALRQAGAAQALDARHQLWQLVQLGFVTGEYPVATAERVDLLVGGAATFDAIFDAIRAARHHVHAEYYIFEPDRIGTALRDLLIAKARAGVTVRLLVDALGSQRLGWRFLQPLRDAGAQVALFHSVRIGRRLRPVTNYRTHRKIVVCDGCVGFTGGVNITDEEDRRTRADAYHDVHLRIVGGATRNLQMVFLEDWVYATGMQAGRLQDMPRLLPEVPPGPHALQIVASGPDNPSEPIHRMQVEAIHAARERVWLTTPYFVPTEPALMALTSAALRGVDVRILVPRRSDSALVSAAARSYYDELLAAGVRIWEYRARMLHSKTLVVDGLCAFIGTANFDTRSFRLNYEVCAVAYGDALSSALAAQFEADLRSAAPVRRDKSQPLPHRLAEALARLCSPVL